MLRLSSLKGRGSGSGTGFYQCGVWRSRQDVLPPLDLTLFDKNLGARDVTRGRHDTSQITSETLRCGFRGHSEKHIKAKRGRGGRGGGVCWTRWGHLKSKIAPFCRGVSEEVGELRLHRLISFNSSVEPVNYSQPYSAASTEIASARSWLMSSQVLWPLSRTCPHVNARACTRVGG